MKLPLASLATCGPKPSGGKRSDVEVSTAVSVGSHEGDPVVGTLPENVTD